MSTSSSMVPNSTRWYISISDWAARTTSTRGASSRRGGVESASASTRTFSSLRRIRVARWSSWNSSASRFGSSSPRSMRSSWPIIRSTSVWLRRARPRNLADLVARGELDRVADLGRQLVRGVLPDALRVAQLPDRLRQVELGHHDGGLAQAAQRTDHRPRHDQGERDDEAEDEYDDDR